MKIERIIVSDSINDKTLDQIAHLYDTTKSSVEITFKNIDILPQSIILWIYDKIRIQSSARLSIYATSPHLTSYFHALHLPCSFLPNLSLINLNTAPIRIIAIGGSAGSTVNIKSILKHCSRADVTIFIAQHLSESSELGLQNILSAYTPFNVRCPQDGETVLPKTVYIAPSGYHMRIKHGKIKLDTDTKIHYARPSISALFHSVAEEYGKNALAILTCGYGKDGSDALQSMKEHGTTILVHSPDECDAKPLVQNAIDTGFATRIVSLDAMGMMLECILSDVSDDERQNFFLLGLKDLYGYDFTLYDRSSISRRIHNAMLTTGITDLKLFYRRVLLHPDSFQMLFLTMIVTVTEFFRKPKSVVVMRHTIQEHFFKAEHHKVWIAGCSSGEEAYSMAMVLSDLSLLERSVIYATDFNPINIQKGRNALYPIEAIRASSVNASIVLHHTKFEDFFELSSTFGTIRPEIRKKVLFFEHNLVTDASFNEFSFISCKNVLIYFSLELQLKVIQLFYDSLAIGGFLQLGTSESLPFQIRSKFQPISIQNKLYQKVK